MKILLVGSDFEYGIEQYYMKYLRQSGAAIVHFPAPDIVFNKRSKNLLNKVLFKLGLLTWYRRVNGELIRLAEQHKPDIIWVFKGMEIFPATLARLGKSFKLVNYNPDHPFIISGPGSGNRNVTDSVGLYHLHFCYNRLLQKQIEERYHIPTAFLPFGFELSPEDHQLAAEEPEINRVCFIGNPGQVRVELLTVLAGNGFAVDIYGHGWKKTELHKLPGIRIYDAVYGTEFWKRLRQYRIQLNIFRKHNIGSHNMRSFEIPAVGGIQLAPWNEEQAEFFADREEVFFYRTTEELLILARTMLSAPKEEMDACRRAARDRSLRSGYSYRDRAATVYNEFKQLIG